MQASYIKRHNHYLENLLQQITIPASAVQEGIHYALFPGGKRIRPLLVYLVGDLLQLPLDTLDVLAASIELMHSYSLVHDDLPAMDNDELRRGKPSCHKAFGEAQAILIGDGLQSLAIEILITQLPSLLPAPSILTISKILLQASGVGGMVSGQSLDLTELEKTTLSEDQLNTIHHLKTGRVLSAGVEMVLAAQHRTCPKTQEALLAYIKHLGLVFQIQDDYLDHYAPTSVLGKTGSSDTANHKTTFATLLSKTQLEKKIHQLYQAALESLLPLEVDTTQLCAFTQALEARSVGV